jgi:hypothetical protein
MSDKPGGNFHPRDNHGAERNRSRNRNRNNRRPRPNDGRRENRRDDHGPRRNDRGPRRRNDRRDDIERVPGPDRKRPATAAKPTLGQKLITILTFGLVRPKSAVPARPPRPEPKPKERQEPDAVPRPPREPRQSASMPPPNPDAVDTERLHVGNLSYEASESDLLDLFKGVGNVQSVDIVYNGRTHRSKGFGFVQMMSINDAKRAVTELHGKPFMGRPLNLGPARSRGRDEREADDEQA